MHYGVPLWSDKHFELMGKSFDLLRLAGNRSVNLYFVCETNHGNCESMVRWIKDGDGYRHDFTIMDKYLDLVEEHMGKPKMVSQPSFSRACTSACAPLIRFAGVIAAQLPSPRRRRV